MTEDDDLLEDPSWLKDRDWIEVNKLRRAYEEGGAQALRRTWRELLAKDAIQCGRVLCAFFPDRAQAIQDAIEARGYSFHELIELAKKRQH